MGRSGLASCADGTYGLFGGGSVSGNTIDYITIATPGNATDFGDLTVSREDIAACSNGFRGLFSPDGNIDSVDYVTIANPGNATVFGDLSYGRFAQGACSGD